MPPRRAGMPPGCLSLALFPGGAVNLPVRRIRREEVGEMASGSASIGGAGTFDGIVLSAIVATLLA